MIRARSNRPQVLQDPVRFSSIEFRHSSVNNSSDCLYMAATVTEFLILTLRLPGSFIFSGGTVQSAVNGVLIYRYHRVLLLLLLL